MQYIGKIDRNKLGKYRDIVVTEDVILTEERIKHIQEHHPGDYENYGFYIPEILSSPDYIINDSKNSNTVLYLKTIEGNHKNIQIVVKLNTNQKAINKQNSILTFWKVKTSTYNQMVRNKEIIFAKLDKNE